MKRKLSSRFYKNQEKNSTVSQIDEPSLKRQKTELVVKIVDQ
jgi:hypothetical protein